MKAALPVGLEPTTNWLKYVHWLAVCVLSGVPEGARTPDLRIKSPLLYHLSYRHISKSRLSTLFPNILSIVCIDCC